LFLSWGSAAFALFLERGSEAVEACFPETAILRQPIVEFPERLRPERVEAPLPVWPRPNEASFVQDAQMTGDTGLVDTRLRNDVVDLMLALPQHFDNATAGRVGKSLEGV
jgi:hypothetical protein